MMVDPWAMGPRNRICSKEVSCASPLPGAWLEVGADAAKPWRPQGLRQPVAKAAAGAAASLEDAQTVHKEHLCVVRGTEPEGRNSDQK
jgi:hypothetical protein